MPHYEGSLKWMNLRCGWLVCCKDNPRHVGRIEAKHNSVEIKVRWRDSGWISFERAIDLERVWE